MNIIVYYVSSIVELSIYIELGFSGGMRNYLGRVYQKKKIIR